MNAQIIFFIALALFLVLLVRRSVAIPVVEKKIIENTPKLYRWVIKTVSTIGGSTLRQAKKIKGNIPLMSTDRANVKMGSINEHQFWHEESPNETGEIAGLFEEGDEMFRQGNYAEAEEFFLKAATRNPSEVRVYARLGVIYLHQKNYNDAIESLKVAVKLDKYNPSRHYNLALAYLGNDDRQKATVSAREAITLDPVTKKYRQLLDHLLERK